MLTLADGVRAGRAALSLPCLRFKDHNDTLRVLIEGNANVNAPRRMEDGARLHRIRLPRPELWCAVKANRCGLDWQKRPKCLRRNAGRCDCL